MTMSLLMLAAIIFPYAPNAFVSAADVQEPIAVWNFPSKDDLKATDGNNANKGVSEFAVSDGRTLSYTASSKTVYTNGWDVVNRYWQAKLNTKGYRDLSIAFRSYGTDTSPKDFKLQYSVNGADFTDVATFEQTNAIKSYSFDLPSEAADANEVVVRWLNYTSARVKTDDANPVAATGNSRMADIAVSGVSTVPKASPVAVNVAPNAWPSGTAITLTSATENATIYYSLTGAEGPYQAYTAPIVIQEAMTLYTYATAENLANSEVKSYAYTVLAKSDIAAARLAEKGKHAWTEGVVTHIDGSNTYIQDASSAIVLYSYPSFANIGDKVSVQGVMDIYNGLQELKPVAGLTYSVTEAGAGAPAPQLVTAAQLNESNEAKLLAMENVEIAAKNGSTVTAKQGDASFTIYSSLSKLVVGAKFERITGMLQEYNGTHQFVPLSNEALVENLLSVQASPEAGRIIKGKSVVLSSPEAGAAIYYTTNGETPTASSTAYTAPIAIEADTTIKAIAVKGDATTEVFSFAYIASDLPRIRDIQGETHASPFNGQVVENIEGVVTQLGYNASNGSFRGFYIQDATPDTNIATSEGIYVFTTYESNKPLVGDLVRVTGTVGEYNEGSSSNMTSTQISNVSSVEIVSHDHEVPAPVVLGKNGRALPTAVIDNDGLTTFDASEDAMDFYESMEGMLVQLPSPTIISPYWVSGSFYNIATRVENTTPDTVTAAGGLILKELGNQNPQRLIIAAQNPGMELGTGDYFDGDVTGVIGYNSGNYKVIAKLNGLPAIVKGSFKQEATSLAPAADKLTIASYNVENFHPGSGAEKINKIAESIVNNLKSPDIIGLIEVQDNNGAENNGTVAADLSFKALTDAISAKGGPAYSFTNIDPVNNQDGGEGGGNIRVGFLYNPNRVTLAPSDANAAGGSTQAVAYNETSGQLNVNPGRIDPTNAAFNASRKPLVGEFVFNGEHVYAVVNHFNSKGGDTQPFGNAQPPVLSSETQRHQIATAVNTFIKDVIAKNDDANFVVLGDLNDFQFTKTLDILKGGELVNMIDALPSNERYSYTYDGNSQTLDHILVSRNLAQASTADVVHLNADFPEDRGRVSDHDPLMVQVDLKGAATESFDLRVLHTNDTHAHLDNVAKRVTAIKENRTDNAIVLDAGDVFSGTLYFTKFSGQADLEFMNMIGYDAMVPGNHEFDKGPAALESFIKTAGFPIVSANIDYGANAGLNALYKNEIGGSTGADPVADGKIYPAVVLDVKGQKVGVFGLTTEETVGLSSPGNTIQFNNYLDSAKATVKSLQDQGINKIIALTHLGYDFDITLAEQVPGIDIIVGGHSHTKLTAPVVKHAEAEPTIIVQTGEYGDFLGQIDASFDAAGVLKTWDGKLLEVAKYAEDTAAKAKLATYASELEAMKSEKVGKSLVDLVYEDANKQRLVRKQETNLGNLITDGMTAAMKEKITNLVPAAELANVKGYVAIQNGGGIRGPIAAGDITMGQVRTVLPYNNSIVALKVTGQELISALENGVSDAPAEKGGFPHVSGMKYVFDSTKAKQVIDQTAAKITKEGERILSVQIKNADGTYSAIDKNAYYMLATNSFTADGGDFYYSLKQAKAAGRYYELYMPDYEVFIDHLKRVGDVNIALEGRIVDNKGAVVPSTPNPTPTPAPTTPTTPSVEGGKVELAIDPKDLKTETKANGQKVSKLEVSQEELKQSVEQAAKHADATTVVLNLGAVDGSAVVQLPAAALAGAKSGLIIQVKTDNLSYDLPVSVLSISELSKSMGVPGDQIAISVNIEPLTGQEAVKVADAANAVGDVLGAPVSFGITATGGGKSTELNNFGTVYVSRSITVEQTVDPSRATAVVYDETTGKISFVPATFDTINGKTVITMKRNSNSIYAVVASSKTFVDLAGHWSKANVELLASKLIVNGASDAAFSPNAAITRAEFAAMLVRALGLKEEASGAAFKDVAAGQWYAGAVGAAVKAGLIQGGADGSFRPNARITREEIAVMIARALTATGNGSFASHAASIDSFADVAEVSGWAKEQVALGIEIGVLQGNGGKLLPGSDATRAEAAVMLGRLLKHVGFIN